MAVIPFNLFSSQTGLTLEAQPKDAANVALGSPLTAGFVEKGGGVYQWTVQPLPAGWATVDIQLHSDHSFLDVSFGGADIGLAGLSAPGTAGGLPTVGTGAGQVQPDGAGNVKAKLTSDGLDALPVSAPTGPATTIRGMIVQSWRKGHSPNTYDLNAGTLKGFADDGATVLITQTMTVAGNAQAQGKAT